MKILVVCDEGNNRSVTVAGILKYVNHDVLTAGLKRNSEETLKILFDWADIIIRTHTDQEIPEKYQEKLKTLTFGPDVFKRPFNQNLYHMAKRQLDQHKEWFGL